MRQKLGYDLVAMESPLPSIPGTHFHHLRLETEKQTPELTKASGKKVVHCSRYSGKRLHLSPALRS